jgi:hypothetical protein
MASKVELRRVFTLAERLPEERVDGLSRQRKEQGMEEMVEVEVPGAYVSLVIETLLGLYGAHAEALGAALPEYLQGTFALHELKDLRRELHAIEDALVGLGWPCGREQPAPLVLAGAESLVREVVRNSLSEAADLVGDVARAYEAGREELDALRRSVEALPALFALFATFEDREEAA